MFSVEESYDDKNQSVCDKILDNLISTLNAQTGLTYHRACHNRRITYHNVGYHSSCPIKEPLFQFGNHRKLRNGRKFLR